MLFRYATAEDDDLPPGRAVRAIKRSLAIPATSGLDDCIQWSHLAEHHGEIDVHTGLDELGRNKVARLLVFESSPDCVKNLDTMGRTHPRREVKDVLRALNRQRIVQLSGGPASIDNAQRGGGSSFLWGSHQASDVVPPEAFTGTRPSHAHSPETGE